MYESMTKKQRKIIAKTFILACLFVFSFSFVHSAFAQPLVPCGIGAGNADCTLCHLVVGFKNIYDYLLYVVLFPATVLVIVIAGIMYMVSSGNKGMLEKAKTAFTYSLAALVLALTAWLIINATLNALGFKNAGSWYNFTCDTTQSKDAGTTGVGGATLPGSSGIPSGSGSAGTGVVSSGNKTLDQLAQYMKENTVYNSNRAGWVNGTFYGDCSSFTQEFWKEAYGVDPGGSTPVQLAGAEKNVDMSTLKPGDLLITSGGGPNGMHSVIYMGNGMVLENVGTGKDVRYDTIRSSEIYGVRRAPG